MSRLPRSSNAARWLRGGALVLVLVGLGAGAASDGARPAEACGGPDLADLGGLDGPQAILGRMAVSSLLDWDLRARRELRFLYASWVESPRQLDLLWDFSYPDEPAPRTSAPASTFSAADLDAALKSGDAARVHGTAAAILEAWIAKPPVIGASERDLARRAADIVDSGPGGKPGASTALWAIERDIAATIPDGYAQGTKPRLAAAPRAALEAKIDAWVARHPRHPLLEYASLWRVRIRYFAGDGAAAWAELLRLHPQVRMRPRVLAEMRYLLRVGVPPTSAQVDGLSDPALLAGLVDHTTVDEARFARWWALAEAAKGRPAAVNLQERLLFWAAGQAPQSPLPAGFPQAAALPSPLWGKLRALALLAAGRTREAGEQIALIPADDERADLAVCQLLAEGRRAEAAAAETHASARTYILRVLATDAELDALGRSVDAALAREARLERAVRLAATAGFAAGAARIAADDPDRAALWRDLATIASSRDSGAQLELARALVRHDGQIFDSDDRAMYRATSWRWDPAARPAEAAAITRSLERSTERWLALEAYTRWLEANPRHRDARAVLAEADTVYARLTNWAGGEYYFWGKHAPKTRLVARLRTVGRTVRVPR